MKARIALAAGALLACASLVAGTITEKNIDKAQEIIDAAVAEHGGPQGIDSLKTLYIEHRSKNYLVDQSRGPEKPWDESRFDGHDAIDLDAQQFVTYGEADGGGFENVSTTVINADQSFQADYRAGVVSAIAEPDFATTSGPFVRVTPALLVRTLRDRAANAYYLGEVKLDGKVHDVVGFSMTVGPAISMYFDRETHRLVRSERVFRPFGLVQYEFSDYKEVDGIPFNQRFRLYVNGDLNIDRENVAIRVNEPLDEMLVADDGLQEIPAVVPDELSRQEIADGVWLVGGSGTYAMFVDMGDYLFAAGGTAGVDDRLALVREVAGDKPLRYGMLTHHHNDHVVAVPVYEAEGATVLAAKAHEKIARAAAEAGDALAFEGIGKRRTLESGGRVIEIIDIGPTAHSENLLVAYLPSEQMLFQADHFGLPASGPVRPAVTSTRSFAEALAREQLEVRSILSAHSPKVATMDDLRQALAAELYQASL